MSILIRGFNVVQNRNLDVAFAFLQAQAELRKGSIEGRIHRWRSCKGSKKAPP